MLHNTLALSILAMMTNIVALQEHHDLVHGRSDKTHDEIVKEAEERAHPHAHAV